MTDLVIPGWAVVLTSGIGTLILGWLIWLTLKTNENDKAIAVNTNNDQNVAHELEKINLAIEKLDGKLDTFLAQELAFFKDQFNTKNRS